MHDNSQPPTQDESKPNEATEIDSQVPTWKAYDDALKFELGEDEYSLHHDQIKALLKAGTNVTFGMLIVFVVWNSIKGKRVNVKHVQAFLESEDTKQVPNLDEEWVKTFKQVAEKVLKGIINLQHQLYFIWSEKLSKPAQRQHPFFDKLQPQWTFCKL